jgi:hypothetical protein
MFNIFSLIIKQFILPNCYEDFLSNQISKIHIEKIHTKFGKFVLGVRAKSSDDAVRGELGSYPILYDILLNMIKFWLHLVKNNDQSSILTDAFSLYNQTTNPSYKLMSELTQITDFTRLFTSDTPLIDSRAPIYVRLPR